MTPVVYLIALTLVLQAPKWTPEDIDAADRATVRLKPSAFTSLPAAVRAELERRDCTIPQSPGMDETPHNVVRGRFMSAKQTDIAVLCSVNRVSTILIFRGGAPDSVVELNRTEDKGWLQGGGGNKLDYSRAILTATPRQIVELHKVWEAPGAPPRVDHDGLHDAFVGKASIIYYWNGQKWLELQGFD